ncbi:MAG: precorrin-4 C(11)-methyltransferase [Deltaproteobacteria bacterium GWC2_56_8]|nr:MAG: precorrin-4 C(11)-methyltransferase [Deltaproteobacteria bacterium GWB2_55_19]OGP38927.1 MAG: precorrin-4 C(11)-methyltransferase [Deltaproteobacteria bacterium GWC2_56_8]
MRLLKEADLVVFTGSLLDEKVIEYCRKDAEALNSASMNLDEITGVMIRAAREGKKVVRLHTGDPSLYGALREQTAILEKEGVHYAVVPGVSSAFASAAALKREFTMPGVTQTVIFTRLEGRTPVPEAERLSALAAHNATICVFLSVSMIDKVVEELLKGYSADTPAACVYKASWEDELIVRGALSDIAGKVKEAGITRHALIIVGRAIGDDSQASLLYDKGFSHGYRG